MCVEIRRRWKLRGVPQAMRPRERAAVEVERVNGIARSRAFVKHTEFLMNSSVALAGIQKFRCIISGRPRLPMEEI
jgi:hypothetical protein